MGRNMARAPFALTVGISLLALSACRLGSALAHVQPVSGIAGGAAVATSTALLSPTLSPVTPPATARPHVVDTPAGSPEAYGALAEAPTPVPTPTHTPSPTPSATATSTPRPTPTPTATNTRTPRPTATRTATPPSTAVTLPISNCFGWKSKETPKVYTFGQPLSAPLSKEAVKGYVSLTFDDGPDCVLTPVLLDILASEKAKAAFFVTGQHVTRQPDLIARMARDGHQVGNHSWDHPNLKNLSLQDIETQLVRTNEAIMKAGAPKPTLFRPPFGSRNGDIDGIAKRLGTTVLLWDVQADDWLHPSPSAGMICSQTVSRAKPGSVVLLHDWSPDSVQAVPCIIKGLREKGLEMGKIIPTDTMNYSARGYVTVAQG